MDKEREALVERLKWYAVESCGGRLEADLNAAIAALTARPADGVVVPREPLILTLWRASSDRTEPQREIIEYIDAILAAAKEPR